MFAAILGCYMGWSTDGFATEAHCYCKASCLPQTGNIGFVGTVLKDYDSSGYLATYNGLSPEREKNQNDCKDLCAAASAPDIGSPAFQAACCAANTPDGVVVAAWSNVGSHHEYRQARPLGTMFNKPAYTTTVTTCTCPKGWLSNTTKVNGGVTTDGRCEKLACKPDQITPYPQNGAPIGTPWPPYGTTATSWGISWGNEFWAWGTIANKGAPTCVDTLVPHPPVCKFQ